MRVERPRYSDRSLAAPHFVMSLDALFQPKSVAIVGASSNPGKIGGMPLRLLRQFGYEGAILPVNPGHGQIQGLQAWSSVRDLPHAPDVAIVAVPASAVEGAVEDCVARGVRSAVLFSSGFSEAGGEGTAMQQRIADKARSGGLTLLGPNCLGVINVRHRWVGTFSPAPLSGLPEAGGVSIASQSGAFGAYAYVLARKAGVGLSQWVTTGNEANVSVADLIDWLADDEQTRVIVTYIEGARDGHRLRNALLKARHAGKPVIVTKVGRTAAGASAAMSHTASLSGEDAVYQAVFEETGAIRAYTIEEMFRFAQAFDCPQYPRGPRLGIITVSGGVGTLMADAASDAGLELPPLPEAIAGELRERIPFASAANPVDVTGQITADFGALEVTAVKAAASHAYDAVALFLAAAPASPEFGAKVMAMVGQIRTAAPQLPLVLSGILGGDQVGGLKRMGCLTYEDPTHAVQALSAVWNWSTTQPIAMAAVGESTQTTALAGSLNEVEGLAWLAGQGIPVVPHRVVRDPEDAVAIWRDMGETPVVLKIVSRDILHKSDVGGVRVGPRTEHEVRQACASILASVLRMAPKARQEGLLVSRLVEPRIELMLGARHDPEFGCIAVLGLGGVAVELDPKISLLSAPTERLRVRALLKGLGIDKRLQGWRGQPSIDDGELVDTIARFCEAAASLGPRLRAIEINPLMVAADGVFAADAVIEMN